MPSHIRLISGHASSHQLLRILLNGSTKEGTVSNFVDMRVIKITLMTVFVDVFTQGDMASKHWSVS